MMLTSLHSKQIRVITEKNGIKKSEVPDEDPINLGVEAIIQSELYGIRSSLDKTMLHKIDLRNRLLSLQHPTDKQAAELHRLNEELDTIGLQYAHPNPYFSNFSKAISRNPMFRRQEFSPEEYKELQALSDELLAEVLRDEVENDKN
jgi:hypothetical protein